MISAIQFLKTQPLYSTAQNKQNYFSSLERTPSKDTVSFGSSCYQELSPELKEMLDNTEFTLRKYNGEIFTGTIREYLHHSVINKRSAKNIKLIHCTQLRETAEEILRKGLDWTKTSRMKCGPGTYFSQSVADSMEQGAGSVPIEGEYIGDKENYFIFEPRFYEAINYNQEIEQAVSQKQEGNPTQLVNKYCHDILQNEMDIDFLYAASGRCSGAFVVLNNNCMKLSKHGW